MAVFVCLLTDASPTIILVLLVPDDELLALILSYFANCAVPAKLDRFPS